MKGITPVIAMILLILIVVALGGVFAAWTTRTSETLFESGTEQVETVTGQLQKSITIDSVDCTGTGFVYIRNMGTQPLDSATELSVYVGGALQTATACTPVSIPTGTVSECNTGYGVIASGIEVRATVPGNAATYKC